MFSRGLAWKRQRSGEAARPILHHPNDPGIARIHSDRAQRKPQLPVELSGVFELRASTRERLQYDRWQRYEPPRMTRLVLEPGPLGFARGDAV